VEWDWSCRIQDGLLAKPEIAEDREHDDDDTDDVEDVGHVGLLSAP
jgi:hypothetical protein